MKKTLSADISLLNRFELMVAVFLIIEEVKMG